MQGVSRGPIDWPAIERDYCLGLEAVRELARRHGVSETAIRRRAKAEHWTREGAPALELAELDPLEIVRRGKDLALRMLDELDVTTAKVNQMRALVLEAGAGDETAQRDAAMKALTLGRRAATLKMIGQAAVLFAQAQAPAGKKAERQAAAEKVAGRFAPGAAPKLAVDNTRK